MALGTEQYPVYNPQAPTGGAPTGGATNRTSGMAQPAEPQIFAGWTTTTTGHPTSPDESKKELRYTPSQFLYAFDSFNRDEYLKFRNMLIAAGVVSPTAMPLEVRSAYESVLGHVAEMNGAGQRISPMGFIKNQIRLNGLQPGEVPGDATYDPFGEPAQFPGRADGDFRIVQKARSVSEITEGEAWATLQSNLQRMLGRDPTDQEIRDFTYRMNQLAAANPSISKTITKYRNGEPVSTNTTTSGGITAADLEQEAYETAQSNPEYAETQAATTYFEATMAALGAIGQT